MASTTRPTILAPLALTAIVGMSPAAAVAQDGASAASSPAEAASAARVAQQASLFSHNVMIAKPDAALAAANALLDAAVTPTDLATAIDGSDLATRLEAAFRRSRGMSEVAAAAASLEVKLESGRQQLARDVARIDEAVRMLVGPMRGQELAKDRLSAAGDRAVPSLLRPIVEGRDLGMDAACSRMLIELRAQAALPLAQCVADLDPAAQRKVCGILGQLGSPVAVPFLLDLAQSKGVTSDVSGAALEAVRALGGSEGPAHAAYAAEARRFLTADPSLAAHPAEGEQLVWRWTEFGGLAGEPISTPIYFDAMAMLLARRALELDPSDGQALAAFIAADLRREARAGEGTADPLFGAQDRSAAYFATAAGAATLQDVLGIGLDLGDASIARAALRALRQTADLAGMVGDGGSPAIKSLAHEDRAVRLEAALTLASVSPASPFSGSDQVVPILAQAVRGGAGNLAGIVAQGTEVAQRVASMAQSTGFQPLTAAADAAEFRSLSSRSGGVDAVVIAGPGAWARAELESVRAASGGAALPAVLVVPPADVDVLSSVAAMPRTAVLSSEVSDDGFRAGMSAATASAGSGGAAPPTEDVIGALARVGLSGGSVYRLADAEAVLVGALRAQEGPVRAAIAELLAMIDSDRAQGAVIDAALASAGDEQPALLRSVAESARRNGPKASAAQAKAIHDLVRSATGASADAAAAAYGALRLPTRDAVDLVIEARTPRKSAPAPAAPQGDEAGSGAAAAGSAGG